MDNLEYLFAGFAVFWAGLLVYLILLQVRLRNLNREIDRLQERLAEREREARPPARGEEPAQQAEVAGKSGAPGRTETGA